MFKVKKAVRETRAAEGEAGVEGEELSEAESAEVRLRNERFDQCVALATSLGDRECTAREMYELLADQPDEEDDRPRRRMSGSGAGGGAAGRRRTKRVVHTATEQSTADAIAFNTDATAMVVEVSAVLAVEPTAMQVDAIAVVLVEGQSDSIVEDGALCSQPVLETAEAAAAAKEAALAAPQEATEQSTADVVESINDALGLVEDASAPLSLEPTAMQVDATTISLADGRCGIDVNSGAMFSQPEEEAVGAAVVAKEAAPVALQEVQLVVMETVVPSTMPELAAPMS